MTRKKAKELALASLTKEQRVYAFDASLARRGVGGVAGERALRKWRELEQAKEVLRQRRLF